MKEYRCCLKFRRRDNSTYTFTKSGVVYLVSATPCVKFHKNPTSCLGRVALTRCMPSFFSQKYKLNYLPFQILDSDHKFGRGDNLTYTLKYVLYGEMGL
jgi:hypothetical protein